MVIIAQRITQARIELNINQKGLAKRANITEANLSLLFHSLILMDFQFIKYVN